MKVRDIITEMNKDVFSRFENHLMVKLTPESFSKDIFQQRADDLISHLENENPPTHVTFLLDEYGYIRDVPHYTFIQYLNEFLGICEQKANSPELSQWKQLFSNSRNPLDRNLKKQTCEHGYDLRYTGKPFFSEKSYNGIYLSVHVSRNIRPPQRANFPTEQAWPIKRMKENQFLLLKEIVEEVSNNEEETKIQFLEENPEILFKTFSWIDQRNRLQTYELRKQFEPQFNVRTQLEKSTQGSDNAWPNFLLTQLLNKQKTERRVSCITRLDAFSLWKSTSDRIAKGERLEPLTLDLVESILMIDIQTGAPRSEEI